MSDLDPEILFEFLLESRENLDGMERQLAVLERDPGVLFDDRYESRVVGRMYLYSPRSQAAAPAVRGISQEKL